MSLQRKKRLTCQRVPHLHVGWKWFSLLVVVAGGRDGSGRGAEAVLDERRVGRVHVHQHVEVGEALGEAQVALIVLDREHEAADRATVQAQPGAHRPEHIWPADVR